MPLQGQCIAQSYLNPFRTDKDIKAMHFYIDGKSEWKDFTNAHFVIKLLLKKNPTIERR